MNLSIAPALAVSKLLRLLPLLERICAERSDRLRRVRNDLIDGAVRNIFSESASDRMTFLLADTYRLAARAHALLGGLEGVEMAARCRLSLATIRTEVGEMERLTRDVLNIARHARSIAIRAVEEAYGIPGNGVYANGDASRMIFRQLR
jgi:hypothetical protein